MKYEKCIPDEGIKNSSKNREDVKPPLSENLMTAVTEKGLKLFHYRGEAYATFPCRGRQETSKVRSATFITFLQHTFYEITQKGISTNLQEEVLSTLHARAMFEGDERAVYLRVAPLSCGGFELDLNNAQGDCISVTQDGWCIAKPKNSFIRPNGMGELSTPKEGGDINKLWSYVNVNESDRILILGWIFSTLRPQGQYPLLVIQGEQNSAKSTTMSNLRSLIDPVDTDRLGLPKVADDLFISAQNNWILSFDNLRTIKGEMSDTLCKLSTGGGITKRKLYSDSAEVRLDASRPVMLNGIDALTSQPDLESRALTLNLPKLQKRKSSQSMIEEFERDKGEILGALMDAAVISLQKQDDVMLPESEIRFPDAIRWVTAAEKSFGFPELSFARAWERNIQDNKLTNVAYDPVCLALIKMLTRFKKTEWTGTASKLLEELESELPEYKPKRGFWPNSVGALMKHLKYKAPALTAVGIELEQMQRTATARPIILRKLDTFTVTSVIDVTEEESETAFNPFEADLG